MHNTQAPVGFLCVCSECKKPERAQRRNEMRYAPVMLKTEKVRCVGPCYSQADRSHFYKATGIRLCARSELLFRYRVINRLQSLRFKIPYQQTTHRRQLYQSDQSSGCNCVRWLYMTIHKTGSGVSCRFTGLPFLPLPSFSPYHQFQKYSMRYAD